MEAEMALVALAVAGVVAVMALVVALVAILARYEIERGRLGKEGDLTPAGVLLKAVKDFLRDLLRGGGRWMP